MDLPLIRGEVRTDEASIETYSRDWSHYRVRPKMVAVPADTADVLEIVEFGKERSIPITARGAGSNQSGSAVGEGIIVLSSRLNRILSRNGRRVLVQPGIIYDTLDAEVRGSGLRLSYSPTSRGFCTIGGNVGTRASGIHGIKYRNADNALRSVQFVDPVHGLVDTNGELPRSLEDDIAALAGRIRNDGEVKRVLEARRHLKSSSGYNIGIFLESDDPREIVTHLMAGAVGTLGILTAVGLELVPVPARTVLYLAFYPTLGEALAAAPAIVPLGPSAVEVLDRHGVPLVCDRAGPGCRRDSSAVLMVEFDEDIDRAGGRLEDLLSRDHVPYVRESDPAKQAGLWQVRESMLIRIRAEMETTEARFPAFADDLGVPPEKLPRFVAGLEEIFRESGVDAIIYGHAGEGNLHIRPMIRVEGWRETLPPLADRVFRAALRCGGTLSGEHGAGRNRSRYLEMEWGPRVYEYFREIKRIFDPADILNPGVMFSTDDLTNHLELF